MIEAAIPNIGPIGIGDVALDSPCGFSASLAKQAFERMLESVGEKRAIKEQALDLATGKSELVDLDLIGIYRLEVKRATFKDKVTRQLRTEKTLVDSTGQPVSAWIDAGENGTGTPAEYKRGIDRAAKLAQEQEDAVMFWVSPGKENTSTPIPHRAYLWVKNGDKVKGYSYSLAGERDVLSSMMENLGYRENRENNPLEEWTIFNKKEKGLITHNDVFEAFTASLSTKEFRKSHAFIERFKNDSGLSDAALEDRVRTYQERYEKQLKSAYEKDREVQSAFNSIAQGIFAAVSHSYEQEIDSQVESNLQFRSRPISRQQYRFSLKQTEEGVNKQRDTLLEKLHHVLLRNEVEGNPISLSVAKQGVFGDEKANKGLVQSYDIRFIDELKSTDESHQNRKDAEIEKKNPTERVCLQQEESSVTANIPAKWQLAEQKVKTASASYSQKGREKSQVLSYHPQKTSEASIKYDSEQVAFALFTLALVASVCDIQDKYTISSLNPPREEKYDDNHQNISMETTQKEQSDQKVARKKVIQALESQKQTPRKKRKEDSLDRVLLRNLSGIELPKAQPLLKGTLALKGKEGLSGSNISESAQILTTELANILTQTEKLDVKTHHQTMEEKSKEMELKNLENEVVSLGKNTLLLLERKSGSREENKKPKLDHSTKEELAERLTILLTAYENKQTPNKLRSYLSALIFQQLKAFRIAGEEPFLLNLTSRLNELSPRISLLEEKLQELEERIKTMSFRTKIKPPRPIIPKENPAYNILLAFVNAKKWTRVPKQAELMKRHPLLNVLDTKEKKRSSSYEQIFKKTDQLLFRRKKGKETVVKQRRQIRLLRQRVLNFLLLNEKLYSALRIDPEEMKKRQKRQPIRKVKTRARLDPKDILFEIGSWRKARFRRPSRKNRAKKTLHNVIFSAKRKFFPKSGIIYEYQTLCSIIN